MIRALVLMAAAVVVVAPFLVPPAIPGPRRERPLVWSVPHVS